MCANSQMNAKKERENQSCWLRNGKVFVYFTNLKLREFASALFLSVSLPQKSKKMGYTNA